MRIYVLIARLAKTIMSAQKLTLFGKHCSSDKDCRLLPPGIDVSNGGCYQSNVPRRFVNRCVYDGRQKRCVRRWKLSDPAYLTKLACQKSHDCPSRLTCTSFDSDESNVSALFQRNSKKDNFVCGYFPFRVWPPGTKPVGDFRQPLPKWFKSGGPLPEG